MGLSPRAMSCPNAPLSDPSQMSVLDASKAAEWPLLMQRVSAGDKTVSERDDWGRLALHYAAMQPDAPLQVFSMLIEAHPAAAGVSDAMGKRPLAYAEEKGAPEQVVVLLTAAVTSAEAIVVPEEEKPPSVIKRLSSPSLLLRKISSGDLRRSMSVGPQLLKPKLERQKTVKLPVSLWAARRRPLPGALAGTVESSARELEAEPFSLKPFKTHTDFVLQLSCSGTNKRWSVAHPYKHFIALDALVRTRHAAKRTRHATGRCVSPGRSSLSRRFSLTRVSDDDAVLPELPSAGGGSMMLLRSESRVGARLDALREWLPALLSLVSDGEGCVDCVEVRTFLHLYVPPLLALQTRMRTWRAMRHHKVALRAARTLQRASRDFLNRMRALGLSRGWMEVRKLQAFFVQRQHALFHTLRFDVQKEPTGGRGVTPKASSSEDPKMGPRENSSSMSGGSSTIASISQGASEGGGGGGGGGGAGGGAASGEGAEAASNAAVGAAPAAPGAPSAAHCAPAPRSGAGAANGPAPASGVKLREHLQQLGVPYELGKCLAWKEDKKLLRARRLVVIAADSMPKPKSIKLLWFAALPLRSEDGGRRGRDAKLPAVCPNAANANITPRRTTRLTDWPLRLCNWRELLSSQVRLKLYGMGDGDGEPQHPAAAHPTPRRRIVSCDGCVACGLGLGLDDDNVVTELKAGGPAAASGEISLGDRVMSIDGEALGGRKLCDVLVAGAATHKLGVESAACGGKAALGSSGKASEWTRQQHPWFQLVSEPLCASEGGKALTRAKRWSFFLDASLFSDGSCWTPEQCLRVSEAHLKTTLLDVLMLATSRRRSALSNSVSSVGDPDDLDDGEEGGGGEGEEGRGGEGEREGEKAGEGEGEGRGQAAACRRSLIMVGDQVAGDI